MPRAPVCPFYGRAKREQLVCLRDGAGTTGQNELVLAFPGPDGPGALLGAALLQRLAFLFPCGCAVDGNKRFRDDYRPGR